MKTIAQAFATRPQPADPEPFFTFSSAQPIAPMVAAAFMLGWLLCRAHRRGREEKARIAGFRDGFHKALEERSAPKAPAIKISPIKLPTRTAQ